MPIHEAAAVGFERAADAYEHGRPGYPTTAVAAMVRDLALGPSATVVDLAAGTGKLTRLLAAVGLGRLVGVEPVAAMRRTGAGLLPGVPFVGGTAEAMPLRTGCADAVVVGQAFHWFAHHGALAEIHRVLRPGGRLGLIWNVRDESVGWVRAMSAVADRYRGDAPWYQQGTWYDAFAEQPWFTAPAHRGYHHTQRVTPDQAVDRIASVSFVAALPPAEHEQVRAAVRAALPAGAELALPYRTDVWVCSAVPAR